MTLEEPVLDARGELCPGPVLKVEGFLRRNPGRAPFSVLVDHRAAAESLESLALLHGWRLEVEQQAGECRVRFLPIEASP